MVSFEEAAAMLDEAAEALPKEIFDKLNGGVNLIPARKTDTDGLLIHGHVICGSDGPDDRKQYDSSVRHIQTRAGKSTGRTNKTLNHEMTHHNKIWRGRGALKSGINRTAPICVQLYGGRLEADSVLFVCMDNAGLSPIAEGLFRLAAAGVCPRIVCASAGLSDKLPEQVNDRAVRAAAAYGADISAHTPRTVTRDMLARFDAVLCMTEEQGDELAQLFPAFDAKIMCLGEKDLVPPLLGGQGGWLRAADRIASEIEYLIAELCGEAEKDEPDRP
jgi:protein-tyrosine-phosphatase